MSLYADVLQTIHAWTPSAPKIEKSQQSAANEEETLPPELIVQLPQEDPEEVPATVDTSPWWLKDDDGLQPSDTQNKSNGDLATAHSEQSNAPPP